MKRIYVVGTADTKGEELAYLAGRIGAAGGNPVIVDVGTKNAVDRTQYRRKRGRAAWTRRYVGGACLRRSRPRRGAFWDPAADIALFGALEATIRQTPKRRIQRLPLHINDPKFADATVAAFREITI